MTVCLVRGRWVQNEADVLSALRRGWTVALGVAAPPLLNSTAGSTFKVKSKKLLMVSNHTVKHI